MAKKSRLQEYMETEISRLREVSDRCMEIAQEHEARAEEATILADSYQDLIDKSANQGTDDDDGEGEDEGIPL